MPTDNALTILVLLARAIPFTTDRYEETYWCTLCDASVSDGYYASDVDNPMYQPKNHDARCPWRLATQLLDKTGADLWRING